MGQQVEGLATADEATAFIDEYTGRDKGLTDLLGRVGFEEARKEKGAEIRKAMHYFPESEISNAVRKERAEAEQLRRDQEALVLTEMGVHCHDHLERFTAAREQLRQAPGIVATFEQAKGGTAEGSLLALWQLDHDITATTEATLRGRELRPTELLALYVSSIEAGTPPCAPVVQVIEFHRDQLVDCVRPFDPLREREQAHALQQLRERIAEVRDGRVPAAIHEAIAAAEAGKRRVEQLTRTKKIALVSRRELAEAREGR